MGIRQAGDEGPEHRIGPQRRILRQRPPGGNLAHHLQPQAHGLLRGDKLEELDGRLLLLTPGVTGYAVHPERAEVGADLQGSSGGQLGDGPRDPGFRLHRADCERPIYDHGRKPLHERLPVPGVTGEEVGHADLVPLDPVRVKLEGFGALGSVVRHSPVVLGIGRHAPLPEEHLPHQVMVLPRRCDPEPDPPETGSRLLRQGPRCLQEFIPGPGRAAETGLLEEVFVVEQGQGPNRRRQRPVPTIQPRRLNHGGELRLDLSRREEALR